MVEIKSVLKGSFADKAGILAGEKLVCVNSHPIKDILDYRFYLCEKKLEIEIVDASGKIRFVKIKKDEYDDIGLEFETFLMDKQQRCSNRCIFCFIDQNPHGMREGIYFKDDDTRLAFLFSNYVTLTNVKDEELYRLCKMHISPVNVSVQATDPELRCMMLGNRFAGRILDQMQILHDGNITMNAQIVLLKGINDGKQLERSLSDLERFMPRLESISVVPVGLTRHRNGLYPLEPFTKEDARGVIEIIDKFGKRFYEKFSNRIVFASDEFYLKAELEIPEKEYYEDYPQLENGVGMIRSMREDVEREIEFLKEEEDDFSKKRFVSVATGMAAADHISFLVEKIKEVWYNIECRVYPIRNDFYGESVTVSGLIVGQDIINQLKGRNLGDTLYIPRCALRHEGDVFLDDTPIEKLKEELGVKVIPTESNEDFLYKLIGKEE